MSLKDIYFVTFNKSGKVGFEFDSHPNIRRFESIQFEYILRDSIPFDPIRVRVCFRRFDSIAKSHDSNISVDFVVE